MQHIFRRLSVLSGFVCSVHHFVIFDFLKSFNIIDYIT